jgi:hypothetical protein
MTERTLKQKVIDNLENALENGYDFTNWKTDNVADDMLTYADYDFPGVAPAEVIPLIEEWQSERKAKV